MIKVNCPCGANLEVSAPGEFQAIDEQYRAKEFYEAHASCLIHEAAHAPKETGIKPDNAQAARQEPGRNELGDYVAGLFTEQEKQP